MWAFLLGQVGSRKFFEDIHRRYGKSHVLFLIAVEVGLGKHPEIWPALRRVIRFAAPTMLDLEEIYHPIADLLFEDCPDDVRPVWTATRGRGHYFFPSTGARLYLFGVDAKHYKKGRGKFCHLAVVDEAAACEPGCEGGVKHLVDSILMPQTMGVNGRIVIATTPPETPGHPSVLLKNACEAIPGAYAKRTLDDNAEWFGQDIVAEYERECGGRDTTAFRREYLCEWIVDEARAAIPEWNAKRGAVVREFEAPPWFFPLVSLDVGFEDPTFGLFGFWDFLRAKLCIVDEIFLHRATTDLVAKAIAAKEAELWPWSAREMERNEHGRFVVDPLRQERRRLYRHSDTDLRLIADLRSLHRLEFAATAKDHKEAQVNELRMFVASERVEIHPRCVHLIEHLGSTVWNKQRTEWERTTVGHGDGVDALLYMLRNAPRALNPYPPKYADLDPTKFFIPDEPHEPRTAAGRVVQSLFTRRAHG